MTIYKTAIYPFNEHAYPLLFHCDLIENLDITQVIAFEGSGIENKEILDFRGRKHIVRSSIDCSNCEAIFLNLFDINEKFYGQIINLLKSLPNEDIKIFVDTDTYSEVIKSLKSYYKGQWVDYNKLNVNLKNYVLALEEDRKIDYLQFKRREFKPVNASVIGICSTNENCMKFNTMLSLYRYFKEKGYSVAGIGSKDYSGIFDLLSFQKEIFNLNLTGFERICRFMEIINTIDRKYSPDIVLVAMPGEIVPISSKHHGDYGILATELFSVLKCDQLVLNLGYSSDYNTKFLQELSNICRYKLNNNVSQFAISNKMIFPQSLNEKELSYVDITSTDKSIDILNQDNYSVFDISNKSEMENLAKSVERNLLLMGNAVFM